MSCTGTKMTSAATSAANFAEPLLNFPQIQSLFHHLKRQGKALGAPDPDRQEYLDGLDRLAFGVRHDSHLSEAERSSILRRLGQARSEDTPDGPTWHATTQIRAAATAAAIKLEERLASVAGDLRISAEQMETIFKGWRDCAPEDYEDVAAPDAAFRYDLDPSLPRGGEGAKRALRKLGYEHYLSQPHPVFVYGTLREGQGNHRLMAPAARGVSAARAEGVAIYGGGWGFPYAVEHEDPSAVTVGEVVWLSDDWEGREARRRLDYLEGFDSNSPSDSHYERVARTVRLEGEGGRPGQAVTAWMYVARGYSRKRLRESERIHHGDWVAERRARHGG